MHTQIRNTTTEELVTLAVADMTSKSTLFAGSNTGITFCVLGPSSSDRMERTDFLFGSVDVGCVVFAGMVRFTSALVLIVVLVAFSSEVRMPDDGRVGVISVDVPPLVGFTKRKLGHLRLIKATRWSLK